MKYAFANQRIPKLIIFAFSVIQIKIKFFKIKSAFANPCLQKLIIIAFVLIIKKKLTIIIIASAIMDMKVIMTIVCVKRRNLWQKMDYIVHAIYHYIEYQITMVIVYVIQV